MINWRVSIAICFAFFQGGDRFFEEIKRRKENQIFFKPGTMTCLLPVGDSPKTQVWKGGQPWLDQHQNPENNVKPRI